MSNVPQGKGRVPTDRHNSPEAGTGAGGTNYMQGSGYDTGTAVKGYIANQHVLNTGQGYLTTPAGEGPGFGIENEGSGHNTGIGATGAGTGTSGYHHGQGASNDLMDDGKLASNRKDAHQLKSLLHLHHHKDHSRSS